MIFEVSTNSPNTEANKHLFVCRPVLLPPLSADFNLGYWQVERRRWWWRRAGPWLDEVRAALPPLLCRSHIKSGSRQSDRLPQEMTPVTEGSAANLQASFCLNSLSPCRQILIFSVTASFAPPLPERASPQSLHNIPPALAHKAHMFPDMFLPTYLLNEYCTFFFGVFFGAVAVSVLLFLDL